MRGGQNLPPLSSARVKAAVHWVCVNALSAESSPKLTWDAMGLRVDSARWLSGSARTNSRRTESARNPIASHVKFGDDSALSALTRTQWTAALTLAPAGGGVDFNPPVRFFADSEKTAARSAAKFAIAVQPTI